MKRSKIVRALDCLDDELISGALNAGRKRAEMKKTFLRWGALAAAFVMLLGCAVMLSRFIVSGTPTAVIALDVNPSLEIEVNEKEKVIAVNALNADALTVIGDMELKGVGLDVAINALIGSMLQNGYISAEQNSILISVDADNAERAALLRTSITEKVSAILVNRNIDPSVLSQLFDRDTEQTEEGASAAVSELADKILAAGLKDAHGNPYTRSDLVSMKINELKLILESKDLNIDGINAQGHAGEGKYIGREAALAAALSKAGLEEADIRELEIELDHCRGIMLYEIEFKSGNKEFDYEINASTGEIIAENIEKDEDDKNDPPPAASIDGSEALAIALKDAGLTQASVANIKCELDDSVWNIDFETSDTEYEYKIDPASGKILHKETEPREQRPVITDPPSTDPVTPPVTDVTTPPQTEKIDRDQALAIALGDAGLTKATVFEIGIELDDGVWSVDFETADTEYDYKIDPADGKILRRESEPKDGDDRDDDEATVPPSPSVTKESALAAALTDAGLTEAQVRELEVEFDDGVWSVEFTSSGIEYEYKIDPSSGAILRKETERED